MKLNNECVRDLLIYLEDNLNYHERLYVHEIKLKNYSSDELLYTAEKLKEANFLNCFGGRYSKYNLPLSIDSITYQGHQFLDSIRDEDVWSNAKSKIKTVASVTLPILQDLCTCYLKLKLGLPN
ncbi:MAG: DUF2513 domain-containing protein [Clostridia bacterium]